MSFDSVLHDHLRETQVRVEALRSSLAASGGSGEVAQAAIEELLTAMEELRVAEEELRRQNETLAATQILLEEENRRYVELFEYAPVAYVVTDEAGVIREGNRAACDLLGMESRAARGKPLVLYVDREEAREFRQRMALASAARSRIEEWEVTLVPRAGDPVPVLCSVQGVRGAAGEPAVLRWMLHDIRARRAAEEAERRLAAERTARAEAQSASQRVRMVLESITDAFVEVDREWRFTYLNRRADEMARRALGRAESLARRAALAVDNARLYEAAQRASRAREEVLAVVSHDLRNPLNAIVLGASLLEDFTTGTEWTPRDRQQLRAIRNASRQMSGLIQDLVEVVALESGSAALTRSRIAAGDLMNGAVELFGEMAAQRGLTFRCETAPGLPPLEADHGRVRRVFSNLIGNALKFTPAGGTITLSAAPADGAVRITVADTGSGIAPEHLPHLFDRYWQVRRGANEGLGLGLAICKGIVEAHAGRIWAESVRGEGASFHFTLPAAEPA